MKIITAVAITGLLFAMGACASNPVSDEPELVVDGEEWECRRKAQIGSNLPKKICASPSQWAEHDTAEAEMAERSSNRIRESGGGAERTGGIGN